MALFEDEAARHVRRSLICFWIDLHHSLMVETGRLGFESSQTGGTVKRLTSNTETPCPFVSIGKMQRPITEKRVYDCPRAAATGKVLGGGPSFLVARGAAHLLKLRNSRSSPPGSAGCGAAAIMARCDAVMRQAS
jgi:hypothetical protein